MKKIVLYGRLAKDFGKEFMIDVKSVAEAIRAMEANFRGRFYKAIKDGVYKVEKRKSIEGDLLNSDMKSEDFLLMKTGCDEIHIEPVLQGAGGGGGAGGQKKKGVLQVVVGVVLVAAATFFSGGTAAGFASTAFLGVSYGAIAVIGVTLAISGITTLLTKNPSLKPSTISGRERPEERPSFIFNGPVNIVEQGGPVALVYGVMMVGSNVINISLNAEDIDG